MGCVCGNFYPPLPICCKNNLKQVYEIIKMKLLAFFYKNQRDQILLHNFLQYIQRFHFSKIRNIPGIKIFNFFQKSHS